MAAIIRGGKFNPLRRLVKGARLSYSSTSRLAEEPSVSNSSLAIVLGLTKAALVSNLSVSALTTAGIWMAIEKGFDVQSGLEKLHLPRPDRPFFNNPIQDHESDNTASFGDKKNRTAELAASKGGSLALALLINKSLFPLRLPFAVALICPVAKLLASWRTINNGEALVQVTLLSITINVESFLAALWMLGITGSYEYAKKPDVKEQSESYGGVISFVRQVLTKGLKELENLDKKDKESGSSQLVVKDLKEQPASSRGGAISLEVSCQAKGLKELENLVKKDKGSGGSQVVLKDSKEESASSLPCQTKAIVDFPKEVEADAVFPASRGKGNGQFFRRFHAAYVDAVSCPW